MSNELAGSLKKSRSGMYVLMLHGACFLLVVLYVNMFQLWAWLTQQLGPGVLVKILPVIATLAVLLLVAVVFARRINKGYRINFVFLGLGIVGAFVALAIPDPNVPIKRIHVAEYIVLSFLVRYTLSHRLKGNRLTLFTVLVTMLYGVHDEMLQGLHALRYYGWRDIVVNASAGLSGAMLGHGLFSYESPVPVEKRDQSQHVSARQAGMFAFLFAAVIWQVKNLYQNQAVGEAYMAIAPLAACCLLTGSLFPELLFNSRENHGLQVVFWLALGLVAYPLLAGFGGMEFL